MALPFVDDLGADDGNAQARRGSSGVPQRGWNRRGSVEPLGGGSATW